MAVAVLVEMGCVTGAGFGGERLKIEFMSVCFGGETVGGEVVTGGEEKMSMISLFEVAGGAAGDFVDPIVASIRLKPPPPDETDGALALDNLFSDLPNELSNNPPPLTDEVGMGGETEGGFGLAKESNADIEGSF